VTTVDVQPGALLDAGRVLHSAIRPSWFDARASPGVGLPVQAACEAFALRLTRATMTQELLGLAHALEVASGTYIFTDDTVAQIVAGHGS
jgi:hypothetical protein